MLKNETCPICQLHGETILRDQYEILRSELWLLRHHPDPAPLAGWLLLDSRRHLAGPIAFNDREAAEWGAMVRQASQLVQKITGCTRVYVIAFGEGAQHLHLHLIPRHAEDPTSSAWQIADLYRSVEASERPSAGLSEIQSFVNQARLLVDQTQMNRF
jgi:diadenosine tetraphosphate (Ap4A) HIT family hydrolase